MRAKSQFNSNCLAAVFDAFAIEYRVRILPETGKVVEMKRSGELLDKRLQRCADKVVSCVRFAPFAKELPRSLLGLRVNSGLCLTALERRLKSFFLKN